MRIALISDVHLGTRQYNLKERYEDFLDAFRRFGEDVLSHRPEAVVIGGDLFDSPRPDAGSVLCAKEVIGKIRERAVNVLSVDGNHDLSDGKWADVIGATPLSEKPVTVGGIRIIGVNYRNGRDLVEEIQRLVDIGTKADIIVLHFALSEMNGGGSADTGVQELCPMLEKMGVRCVLMGHVHIPDARTWNGILFVNPGSTEMKSSNEPEEKYWFLLETDTWNAEPVRLRTRKVGQLEISSESDLANASADMAEEDSLGIAREDRTFWQIIADDSVNDVFKRLSQVIHDTSSMGRIIMRSSKARDLAPVVDRKESVATLASAIEARFPRDSSEARLTASFLHSPEPASIHLLVEKFMSGQEGV